MANNNANAGGSYILDGWEQSYVRSVGLIQDLDDLGEIVLRADDGTPVLMRDLAKIRVGHQTRQGAVTRDGEGETVAGMVIMLRGENSKAVVDRVRGEIPLIQDTLPDDVTIDTYYDRTDLIQACVDTVGSALLQGGLLVIVVLFLFMWNLRAALTVALSLPLTALLSFIAMDAASLTANLMSLGGLTIAIGMVVDGTIVVTENVVRHMSRDDACDLGPAEVARRAASEVARPVAFAVLIIIVVFLPLLTLEGMEGKMFRPLALTMVFAMASSLVVALTIVPALEGSVEVAGAIERRLGALPEVETVVSKTGRAEISEDPMGPDQSDVFVILKPESEWTTGRSKRELVEVMERSITEIPGLRPSFSQPIALRVNELVSGIKADVAIKVSGDDLELLRQRAEQIGQLLGELPGAADVRVEQTRGFRQLEVVIDRRAISRFRLNVADSNEVIETAVGGRVATEVVEGQRRFAVLVRFPEERREDAEAIGSILVSTPEGSRVPLSRLARIEEVEAPAQVSRESGRRRVVVECNVRGRDLGGFVAELQQRLEPIETGLPPGYSIDVAGQFENQRRAMTRLMIVVPLSIALIAMLLAAALRSGLRALVVVVNLPFALVGGVFVLSAFDIDLSVSAAVGFIALFGIAVENGVVLVTFFDQLVARGWSVSEAVREGCVLRLRPLLMTTMTTLLGLTPMVLASGAGSEIQRPLAAVVLGGLVTSTGLTLFVLPVIYAWIEGARRRCPSSRGGPSLPFAEGLNIDRQAMIVANPVVRMLAKVILKLDYSAKRAPGQTVFVSTPEEATRYLVDEREKIRAAAPNDDEPPQR